MRLSLLLAVPLLALPVFSADLSRAFQFTRSATEQEVTEAAASIRAISEVRTESLDGAQRSFVTRGSEQQLALAAWLFAEIDKPSNMAKQYRYSEAPDGAVAVRIFYPGTRDQQQLNELASVVRATTETRRLVTNTQARAIILRGAETQAASADWLIPTLSGAPPPESSEFRPPGGTGDVLRVTFLPPDATEQHLNEVAVTIRALGEVRRLLTYTARHAIVMAGTAEQSALAAWLAGALGKAPEPVPAEPLRHRYASEEEFEVRVFYLPRASQRDLAETTAKLRRSLLISPMLFVTDPSAIVLRGNPNQVAFAEQLLKEALLY